MPMPAGCCINPNLWAIVEVNSDIDRIASTAIFSVQNQERIISSLLMVGFEVSFI